MMRKSLLVAVATLSLLTGAKIAFAEAVAVVASLSGSATVRSGGSERALKLFDKLEPGDVVRCGGDGEAVLTLIGSSERYRLASGGTAKIGEGSITGAQKASGVKGPSSRILRDMVASRVSGLAGRQGRSYSPITPEYTGYLSDSERNFTWTPVSGAASYGFTVADKFGNVVFHTRTTEAKAMWPADIAAPSTKTAYIWRLVPYSATGKAKDGARWGVLTFLAREEAAAMNMDVRELQSQVNAKDTTALLLLVGLYREYGVYDKVFELLDAPSLKGKDGSPRPGVAELEAQFTAELGPFAKMLAE